MRLPCAGSNDDPSTSRTGANPSASANTKSYAKATSCAASHPCPSAASPSASIADPSANAGSTYYAKATFCAVSSISLPNTCTAFSGAATASTNENSCC